MNLKRVINRNLYVVVISLMALTVLLFTGSKLFVKLRQVHHDKVIARNFDDFINGPDYEEKINNLLKYNSLSLMQKSQLYNILVQRYYTEGRMQEFLDTTGYALFYSEKTGLFEEAVNVYALLAQYYFEIGADSSGFDVILTGRRLRNFYSITNPVYRSQALHAYGRFLVYESDYDSAYKAVKQMENDAKLISETDEYLGNHYMRRALALKSYILLKQGKIQGAASLANVVYEQYYNKDEVQNHIFVYDFLLPVLLVKTQCALIRQDYKDAIEYNKEYGKWAKKFNFIMKKVSLEKDVLFALPLNMVEERDEIFKTISFDTDYLSQSFLDNYTGITGESLQSVLELLEYTLQRQSSIKHVYESFCIILFVFLFFFLILLRVYDETQTDGLTKLRNRRSLSNRLIQFASAGKNYSAIMIDIDNFKKLNDTYGHDFGDEVLRGVSNVLIKAEAHNVHCYRYGGEELAVILDHFDLEHAVRLSEYLRHEISSLKWPNNVHVTASFGVGFNKADAIKEADENMYIAKQKGKNFTAYRKDGIQYLAERRLDIRNPIPDCNKKN